LKPPSTTFINWPLFLLFQLRVHLGTKIARRPARGAISKSARSVVNWCCQAGDHQRSHFFCSFHALMLKKALEDRIEALMIDLRP
jgi:hypothetical protein